MFSLYFEILDYGVYSFLPMPVILFAGLMPRLAQYVSSFIDQNRFDIGASQINSNGCPFHLRC
jgi:hypothetical protein